MDRQDFNEEHDAKVAKLAEQLMRDWNRKLLAREPRAVIDLHQTVLDRMVEDDAKELFVLAATGIAIADVRFACMAHDAMYAVCQAEAKEQVERNLRAAADDHADWQIDMAIERRRMESGLR